MNPDLLDGPEAEPLQVPTLAAMVEDPLELEGESTAAGPVDPNPSLAEKPDDKPAMPPMPGGDMGGMGMGM